jgi:Fibrinogen beta and gamma chains, C-terminal globular domain
MATRSKIGIAGLGGLLAAWAVAGGALGACVVDEVTFKTGDTGSCTDQIRSGSETGVDCGGSCAPCALGGACAIDGDCASGGRCDAAVCQASASCAEIHARHPAAGDGVYPLAPDATAPPFEAVCDMSRDGGGWTLLLKADGGRSLAYSSSAWTDDGLLNQADLTVQPGNAKYASFIALPIQMMRGELDGFRYTVSHSPRTARQVFAGEPIFISPYPTFNTGAPNWVMPIYCHTFGTNLSYDRAVRFGWIASESDNCDTNEGAIGLGGPARGAGYLCASGECSPGPVDAGGHGLLWGR